MMRAHSRIPISFEIRYGLACRGWFSHLIIRARRCRKCARAHTFQYFKVIFQPFSLRDVLYTLRLVKFRVCAYIFVFVLCLCCNLITWASWLKFMRLAQVPVMAMLRPCGPNTSCCCAYNGTTLTTHHSSTAADT